MLSEDCDAFAPFDVVDERLRDSVCGLEADNGVPGDGQFHYVEGTWLTWPAEGCSATPDPDVRLDLRRARRS